MRSEESRACQLSIHQKVVVGLPGRERCGRERLTCGQHLWTVQPEVKPSGSAVGALCDNGVGVTVGNPSAAGRRFARFWRQSAP